jgi:nickel/cobalt transporter (NicO) family protein
MAELIIGSFLLSVLHAIIPNHWAPVLAIARSERWTLRQVTGVTVLVGLAHIGSTVLLGGVLVLLGYKLAQEYTSFFRLLAPAILFGLGLLYLVLGWFKPDSVDQVIQTRNKGKSKAAVILGLTLAMLFSPCLELGALYIQAGQHGWPGFILVSLVYLLVTLTGMLALVIVGYRNLNRLKGGWLAAHEKQVTGLTLILLAVFSYFLN